MLRDRTVGRADGGGLERAGKAADVVGVRVGRDEVVEAGDPTETDIV